MCGGYCPGVLQPAAGDIFPASVGFEAYIQPNTGHVLTLNVSFLHRTANFGDSHRYQSLMPLVATKSSPISLERTVFEGFIQKPIPLSARACIGYSAFTISFAYLIFALILPH
jgi:hypothetical protein